MSEAVRTENAEEGVVRIVLDDGKANALSPALLDALNRELDRAEKDASAVVLVGREGRFCAGFDLSVMRGGADAARSLVGSGAELCMRLFEFPKPVVAAVTGHALAAGILVVAVCDYRVGARGSFKLGLNEVAIGMTLPHFGREIARERLSKRHFDRAVVHAELYAPDAAVDAGYLDVAVEPDAVVATATEHALRLSKLDPGAFAHTKRALHADAIARIRERLQRDLGEALPRRPDAS